MIEAKSDMDDGIPFELANPNPRALIESLRSVGYSLQTAVADIIDNSVTARANNVWVDFRWSGADSSIAILDDGRGMTERALHDAMRPGTMGPTERRDGRDLGRFGLGLKTASFSQCRRLTVWSKTDGGPLEGRRWDLDYVVKHNAWRLQKGLEAPSEPAFGQLERLRTGTLILWTKLSGLVAEGNPGEDEQQRRFLSHLDDVRHYLAMTFHRYLQGKPGGRQVPLRISINGTPLTGWNPFSVSDSVPSDPSPIEVIPHKGEMVRFRGYVLPHKDRLSEDEFKAGGGPLGWIAQQGFYIYRNDRMLLAGDWLRLGRGGRTWAKEEQYKLARLSIDIGNALDLDWALDVKKSTARPPMALRERLTGLAESIRNQAKGVFIFRGTYGPRPIARTVVIERPWTSVVRSDRTVYQVNRDHALVKGVLRKLGPLAADVEAVLRLLEETVPVQRIWIDTAESEKDHAIPYEGLTEEQLRADIVKTYEFLRGAGLDRNTAIAHLLASEPFNRFPSLIETIGNAT